MACALEFYSVNKPTARIWCHWFPVLAQPFWASSDGCEAMVAGLGRRAVTPHTLHTTHATHHTCYTPHGANVQPGKADSRFHHVRLHTVKRRKTSGCKKKKQKCNPCPRLFLWGNKKLPDQVLSRVGGEESWGAKGGAFYNNSKGTRDCCHATGQTLLTLDDIIHVFLLLLSTKNCGGEGQGTRSPPFRIYCKKTEQPG